MSRRRLVRVAVAAAACAVLMAGCDDCATVNDLPGAALNGPGEAEGGKPAIFTVRGQLGDGKACPQTVQFSYVELDAKGQELSTKDVLERGTAKVSVTNPPTAPGKPCKLVPLSRALTLPRSSQQRRYRVWASISRPTDGRSLDLDVASAPVVVTVRPSGTASPSPAANTAPVADYIVDRSPAVAGATATFDARQSGDDSGIVRYEWDLYGDGTYERLTYTPEAQFTVGATAAGPLRMKLRVTDNGGLSAVYDGGPVPVVNAVDTFVSTSGPTVPATGQVNQGIAGIGSGQTTPTADRAELFCNEALVDTVTPPPNFFSSAACKFSTPGFKTVAVRHRDEPQGAIAAATFYRLIAISSTRNAQTSRARAAARLRVPLRLTGARIRKRGKLKKSGLKLTVKDTVVTGTGRGTVPKRTPKALRSGLRALASGRLAAKLSGSVSLLGNDDLLGKGSGTLLVRSRKSRKTQVCLKLSAPKPGGSARLKVLGATGKAAGLVATGTTPAVVIDGVPGRSSAVTLSARKGKKRGLNRTCRSLARTLSGK